jgi:hypothetical protein
MKPFSERDVMQIARLLREQHGSDAENFVRKMIRHFEVQRPEAATAWRPVLDTLLNIRPGDVPEEPDALEQDDA